MQCKRNYIGEFEDDEGNRVYEDDVIVRVITDYFKGVFLSEGSSNVERVLNCVGIRVTEEMNFFLWKF